MSSDPPTLEYTPDETEPLSAAIITALSRAKGRDVTEEECILYESIDPEALDGIFREDGVDDSIKVEFTTHDAIVVIWGNGGITIQIQDLEADPHHSETTQ